MTVNCTSFLHLPNSRGKVVALYKGAGETVGKVKCEAVGKVLEVLVKVRLVTPSPLYPSPPHPSPLPRRVTPCPPGRRWCGTPPGARTPPS